MFRVGAEGTITPKKLAADLSLTKGAITGVTSRLVDAGFVSRGEHPHDRRSLHLELTASGHEAMRAVHREFRAMFSTSGTGITDADLLVAASVLEELSARAVGSTVDRP
jgi:DNA-binding MarR family transcriptional regulator